jgi:hypothetical protein
MPGAQGLEDHPPPRKGGGRLGARLPVDLALLFPGKAAV